jgi:hypothetical protein
LHPLCLRFIHGESLTESPVLRDHLIPLKFVILIEASAERNHAVAQHGIALRRHHTEPFFSLAVRMPFILAKIEEDDSFVKELADCCSEVRNPTQMAECFGFSQHPAVVHAISAGASKRELQVALRPVVYRCDIQSQFAQLGNVAQAMRQRSKLAEAPRIQSPVAGAPYVVYFSI